MRPRITLTDDGELTEAVDVPDHTTGAIIHFTTGRDANYPVAAPPMKGKYRRRASLLGQPWATWLLVIVCVWTLAAIIVLISIGR